MNILVGTPAYGSLVHTDYLHFAIGCNRLKDSYSFLTLGNESHISRARNKIFSIFYHHGHFDWLVFIDADVGIEPRSVERLISRRDDAILAAPVLLKHPARQVVNYGEVLAAEGELLKVDRVGTAVMAIPRKVATRIVAHAEENGDVYYHNQAYSRGAKVVEDKTPIYDVFKSGVCKPPFPENEFLSEDYYFCLLAGHLGIDVFIDPSIQTVHNAQLGLQYKGGA